MWILISNGIYSYIFIQFEIWVAGFIGFTIPIMSMMFYTFRIFIYPIPVGVSRYERKPNDIM